jgi:hypothetical protein
MPADDQPPAPSRPWQGGAQVDHADHAERRGGVEGLVFDGQACGGQFLADVVAGLLDGGGAGGTRADLDDPPQILERARAVERRRGLRRLCTTPRHGGDHKGHKDHEDHEALVIFVIFVIFVSAAVARLSHCRLSFAT